jgi:cytochrome c-type biogenesis protein CcmH
MIFWSLFAFMTGVAIFAVLWPLGRARTPVVARDADLAVYRDQLAEIERDHARGLLPAQEAEAARIEVSRRLIAAGDRAADVPADGALRRRRLIAISALAGVPLLALFIYGAGGTPGLPDLPLAARLALPPGQQDVGMLVHRIEMHLAQNPDDARGWELLAPVYLRLGRADDAVKARERVLQLEGSNAAREADLGEALAMAAGGAVTQEARAAFERALKHDAANTKAKFYLDFAARQQAKGKNP